MRMSRQTTLLTLALTATTSLLLVQQVRAEAEACQDLPGWLDVDGDGCAFYEALADDDYYYDDLTTNCDVYGYCCTNMGHTAQTACCVCGGGVNFIETCEDDEEWVDCDGLSCEWYDRDTYDDYDDEDDFRYDDRDTVCSVHGTECPGPDGRTASEACCRCGGGKLGATTPAVTDAPTKAPVTSSPTKGPTKEPVQGPTKAPVATPPPTKYPTKGPTPSPTAEPTISFKPTMAPTTEAPSTGKKNKNNKNDKKNKDNGGEKKEKKPKNGHEDNVGGGAPPSGSTDPAPSPEGGGKAKKGGKNAKGTKAPKAAPVPSPPSDDANAGNGNKGNKGTKAPKGGKRMMR
uniref:Uncharacterized protein n=1 Tax=Leptocylindrus danicus TaxID=163516 RepID=A0A7S2L987_9STRA|mmetsp:Transcript_33519/g.48528  ORF Transcript_33519/g.48528 Transcript_33519/m.48528 type:complete len:345 (+) Transcript_33519:136-1170(+)